ncbi:SRPBCC domain-containing protein [Flavihumibacter stibioxidans]|uniref:ATPase n=1 Tax=Flavihumibacter stibioxidans TaxID=1834163 RepID=A0ABR7M8Z9_9BACT|nr:SRPBCC domain-containing protein [Flavihumibacter stibioxidans]MBC6491491.1 ATPase [Flavihumibacter stibioxidans]
MEKQSFRVLINASREKVWNILWDDSNYRKWTTAFCEGSYAETDWQEGSSVLFLSPGGNGMVSRIVAKRPPEYMSFRHLGEVKNGVEDTTSDKVKAWAGAEENYTLIEKDGDTELVVEMDMNDEMRNYFMDTWPKALEKLKELSETP